MLTKEDLELLHLMSDEFVRSHGLKVSQQVFALLIKLNKMKQEAEMAKDERDKRDEEARACSSAG